MPHHIFRSFAPLTIALALGACADLTGVADIYASHLVGIAVDQGAIVEVGDTVRVTAAGDLDGIIGIFSYDPILDARWSIADPSIAQLQPLPPPPPEDSFPRARTLLRGLRPGTTRVIATARGVSGEAFVRVIPVLSAIQVLPSRDTLAVGDTIRVTAAALDAGGATVDGLRLTFALDGGLQLIGRDAASARVVAVAAGPATFSARFRRAVGEAALVVVP